MNPQNIQDSKRPDHKSSPWPSRVGKCIFAASVAFIFLSIVFPGFIPEPNTLGDRPEKVQALQQADRLANACKLYEVQYSVLPLLPDQEFEQPQPTDTKLINILTGIDLEQNPKETAFIEGNEAKAPSGSRPVRSGFIPHSNGSQSLVDPWGNHYMTICDFNDDGNVTVPGIEHPFNTNVVAWSYGIPPDKKDYHSALKNPPSKWLTSWQK